MKAKKFKFSNNFEKSVEKVFKNSDIEIPLIEEEKVLVNNSPLDITPDGPVNYEELLKKTTEMGSYGFKYECN